MEFEEAKKIFEINYGEQGFEWIDSGPNELIFRADIPSYDINILISEDEINEYANFMSNRSNFSAVPTQCSICSTNYRESMLSIVGKHYQTNNFIRNEESKELRDITSSTYAKIGPASTDFINYFRFDEAYIAICMASIPSKLFDMIKGNHGTLRNGKPLDFSWLAFNPTTIKIFNLENKLPDRTLVSAIDISSKMIEACLLKFTYEFNYIFSLASLWSFESSGRIPPYKYPTVSFDPFSPNFCDIDPEIIRVYQRGKIAKDPFVKFISFYQVLEYYFILAAERRFHEGIDEKLNQGSFSATPKCIGDIIRTTRDPLMEKDLDLFKKFLRGLSEKSLIQESLIIGFITNYETSLGTKIYSQNCRIFGEDVSGISLRPSDVLSSTASRIIQIRNALVHSSDKYERKGRYIPKSEHNEALELELPLIDTLATLVITAPIAMI